MTIGKGLKKNRFKRWQLCGVEKLPFCDHKAIKLTQNCVSFTNPCNNLFVPPSVTGKYYPKAQYLNFSTCCSVLPLTCSAHCLRFVERHNTSVFFYNFHHDSVARSRKLIECMLKTLLRKCEQYQIFRKK